MKKAGFYTVLNTILPRDDGNWNSAREAERATYNSLVRGNAAGVDAVNDLAADSIVGDPNPNWRQYYLDDLHPSYLGQQRLVTINTATLMPLLAKPPLITAGV
jgi:hypothetical protein